MSRVPASKAVRRPVQPHSVPPPIRLNPPIDLTATPINPPKIVADIADVGRSYLKLSQTCEDLGSFATLRHKRKEIEEYTEDGATPTKEFLDASDEMFQLYRDISIGKTPDPARVGKMYTKMARTLGKTHVLSAPQKVNPLTASEMGVLYNVCRKHPQAQAKRLKTGELDSKFMALNQEIIGMSSDLVKIQKLAKEMSAIIDRLPSFSRPEFRKLEETFISHYKGVMNDVTTKELNNASVTKNLNAQLDQVKVWYERKMYAIRVIITMAVCQHKLNPPKTLFPDDEEEFTRILEMVKKEYQDRKLFEEMGSLCNGGDLFPTSSSRLPVYIPFNIKFALQESGDGAEYKLLFGTIPCVPIEFEQGDPTLSVISQLSSQVPYNNQIYIPKIFCCLRDGSKVVLVFEHVPSMKKEAVSLIAGKISEEHRKNMVLGFAGMVENLARAKRVPMLTFNDLRFTKSCQVFMHPRGFQGMVTMTDRDTPLPSPLLEHPDASVQANFALVYVGWLIEFLEFGTFPFKMADGIRMKMPDGEKVVGSFTKSMYQILQKLYVSNSGFTARTVTSAVSLVSTSVHPTVGSCIFSARFSDFARYENVLTSFKSLFKDYDINSGVDLGSIDRGKKHNERFTQMIQALNESSFDGLAHKWDFSLPDEKDRWEENSNSVVGNGPFKSLIMDFFASVYNHNIFEDVNGKMVFATKNTICKFCTDHESPLGVKKECWFYGKNHVYEAIGRVCQTSTIVGMQWTKSFSLVTVHSFVEKVQNVTVDMCLDLYPNVQKILQNTEVYGPVRLDAKKQVTVKALSEITEPFGIPNTVDLGECFPSSGINLSVPITLVPLYLLEGIQTHADLAETYASRVRYGLGHSDFWEIFKNTPPSMLLNIMAVTDEYVDPVVFLKKIKFGTRLDAEDGSQRRAWFNKIMGRRENNEYRKAFLMAIDENVNIGPHLADESILVKMFDRGRGPNDLYNEYGGVDLHSCWLKLTLPYFEKEEELVVILASIGSSGTGGAGDVYTNM